jgi:hypothetical protein
VLDVPVATYEGTSCALFGVTVAFTPVQLSQLYPTHNDYVQKIFTRIQQEVTKGLLLPSDGTDLLERACASSIGGPPTGSCPRITARSPYRLNVEPAGPAAPAARPASQPGHGSGMPGPAPGTLPATGPSRAPTAGLVLLVLLGCAARLVRRSA